MTEMTPCPFGREDQHPARPSSDDICSSAARDSSHTHHYVNDNLEMHFTTHPPLSPHIPPPPPPPPDLPDGFSLEFNTMPAPETTFTTSFSETHSPLPPLQLPYAKPCHTQPWFSFIIAETAFHRGLPTHSRPPQYGKSLFTIKISASNA